LPTIYVDGKPYPASDGVNFLEACLSLGFDLPYFCWHPAMGAVGACRQCAVKQFRDEKDTEGRLVMACMTDVSDGARIALDDPVAREFRESVIEWLMVNHPHDCPVCDEGGECHLQDMTVMAGHTYRRYRGAKRTYRNQNLGPFVGHEMNRCIQCYRCVRFYQDYAGGDDLHAFRLRNESYFGRSADGVLESEFSGNLAEVCPTGVFTDKTLARHYTRKWDLQTAPSVCVHCAVGCNTIPGERYGSLRRILNRYNYDINGYFLCDRGRFGYEFLNSGERLKHPVVRAESSPTGQREATDDEAVSRFVDALDAASRVIGIGSPRASLEANFALRTLVGADNFYLGMPERERTLVLAIIDLLQSGAVRSPSLREIADSDAVLVLGEDLTNTAPMIDLALRQSVTNQPYHEVQERLGIPRWDSHALQEAVQEAKGPLFVATPSETKLDRIATETYRGAPDQIARLGQEVAAKLGAVENIGMSEEVDALAARIARALQTAEHPLVIAGTSLGVLSTIQAAANAVRALSSLGRPASLSYVVPECNSLGLGLMKGAGGLEAAFSEAESGESVSVIILENDLYRRAESRDVQRFLHACGQVIVLDHLQTPTADAASIALPASAWAEADGTLVNNEGRAQRFYQVYPPEGEIQESWRWLRDVMDAYGRDEVRDWNGFDQVVRAMLSALPALEPLHDLAPSSSFNVAGLPIARQTRRDSGRTAMYADRDIHEPKPPADPDSAFRFSMEGYPMLPGQPIEPSMIARAWAPGWNSVQAWNKFQDEVGGPLSGGDPGRRLFEMDENASLGYSEIAEDLRRGNQGEWLLLASYHIYGSEELSSHGDAVGELAPGPYLGLNAADAATLQLREGDSVTLSDRPDVTLPLRIFPSLAPGVALVPMGLRDVPFISLPRFSRLAATTGVGAQGR